ncbi:MAG: hypothetical protein H0W44_00230 [Gammaproteobacteria bacterium]|nr:hypothetical protein [Gammaproteobacteria bacterium]
MKILLSVLTGAALFLYPFAVYFGITHLHVSHLALALLSLLLLRVLALPKKPADNNRRFYLATLLITITLCLLAAWRADALYLKFYPVVVNLSFLCVFGLSLRYPPSVIERIARIKYPDIPPAGVQHARNFTVIWCVFFILNASVAFYTAVYADTATWALYNGLIAYALMGCLFAAEWLYRKLVLKV